MFCTGQLCNCFDHEGVKQKESEKRKHERSRKRSGKRERTLKQKLGVLGVLSQVATRNKCIATSNKCLTSSNNVC